MLAISAWAGEAESVLYTFTGGIDGGLPEAGLIFDKTGNLYGTTVWGGDLHGCNGGCGTVYKLSPKPGGGWVETVLYAFKGGDDGWGPQASLIFDEAGVLYGTTAAGGKSTTCTYPRGCGTVFELRPIRECTTCSWQKITLHNFAGGSDGQTPEAPLVFDPTGNLYGTTYFGGGDGCYNSAGCGTVFELKRSGQGKWTETVLYRFTGGADGAYVDGGVTLLAGKLYGTTYEGGGNACYGTGCGTVFELGRSNGKVVESVVYSFSGTSDGAFPIVGLIADSQGRLYGTTGQGGTESCSVAGGIGGCGTVFTLINSGNTWAQKVLYSFSGDSDGILPQAGLTFYDTSLYGTTYYGGRFGCNGGQGCGTVFELEQSDIGWTEDVLFSFDGSDGEYPFGGNLIFDGHGDLYGTTSDGGSDLLGDVFQVTP